MRKEITIRELFDELDTNISRSHHEIDLRDFTSTCLPKISCTEKGPDPEETLGP